MFHKSSVIIRPRFSNLKLQLLVKQWPQIAVATYAVTQFASTFFLSLVQYVSDSSLFFIQLHNFVNRAREMRKKISSVRRTFRDSSILSTWVLFTADFMNEKFFLCSRIIIRSSKKGNVLWLSINYEMKTFSMLRKKILVSRSGNN